MTSLTIMIAVAGLMCRTALPPVPDDPRPEPLPAQMAAMAVAFNADDVVENPQKEPPKCLAPCCAGKNQDKADSSAAATEPDAESGSGGSGDPVLDLLETLERSAESLSAFTASVHYEVEDALLGDKVIRKGELIYRVVPDANPGAADPGAGAGEKSFAILFNSRIENRRKRDQRVHYIFSGRWLIEIDNDEKLFIKREIVRPGEEFDPFKLGQGPLPLPIGQSKDEVLARFDASLCKLPDDGPLKKLKGAVDVDGLLLVPKPGSTAAEDFEQIEVFYDRKTHLPVGIKLIEAGSGNRKTARLDDAKRNPELTEAELAKLSIEEPDATQWRIDVRPLERK